MTRPGSCPLCAWIFSMMINLLCGFAAFPMKMPKRPKKASLLCVPGKKGAGLNLATQLWALRPSDRAYERALKPIEIEMSPRFSNDAFLPLEQTDCQGAIFISNTRTSQSVWLRFPNLALKPNLLWNFYKPKHTWFLDFSLFFNPSGYFYFTSPFKCPIHFCLFFGPE